MTAAIRFFDPIADLFSGVRKVGEVVTEVPDPGAARECLEQLVYNHPGCESEAGAQMIMAMYPDQF